MSLEELVGTFKVHEQELQQDEGIRRDSLWLSVVKRERKNHHPNNDN